MLEISGDDIALLGDGDLRELIGLLCEADCQASGVSTSGVIWGGHQDAKDGGLDVVIEDVVGLTSGFIPRSRTGFQVKKPDIPAAAIMEEMKPKGELRETIKDLINKKGSYIVVSSTGSTTAKALDDRRTAIRNAVKTEANHEDLHVDFYDRGRIATWVRSHPSLMLWVRNRLGKGLKGWMPFENWTQPGEVKSDYLVDQEVRLYDGTGNNDNNELLVVGGLNKIRSILSITGSCVRIVGLSGVGKTRFVQALFDKTIGEHVLNSSQVIYTDISNGPDPDPRTMAEQLIAQKAHSVLIVDNCPPDLHRRLTEVCSGSKSTISLITVEYDVRDDLPEETHVFRLEPAGDELIYQLIKKRFEYINDVDARTITNFAGGNARIALALANTVHRGETLSGFHNEELFERLFRQRNQADPQLLKSAQILALVYSFEGLEVGLQSELSILAPLVGKTAQELYGDISELKDRNLIQTRSVWRAVLPQAIANRLAKKALSTIPIDIILTTFVNNGTERLLKSFTRRLSYLHDCQVAVQIANNWLSKGGWLENVENINNLGIGILENIAPVSPIKALEAIERAAVSSNFINRSNVYYDRFIRLLRSIAFDEIFFIRSTRIICQFALNEKLDGRNNSTINILKSLFLIVLSGTHASASTRYSIIQELFDSNESDKQDLGLVLLDNTLEAWNFGSPYGFDFGARPRDYGYRPKTQEEVKKWYKFFLDKIVELTLLDNELSLKVKRTLADNFRGLWTKVALYDELEEVINKITINKVWGEGWVEVRKTIYYDKNKLEPIIKQRLDKISDALKPRTLYDLVKTYVSPDRKRIFDPVVEEGIESGNPIVHYNRTEEVIKNFGVQLAYDAVTLESLLPELLSSANPMLWNLGQGLAIGCRDKAVFWRNMKNHLLLIDNDERNVTLLYGFLKEVSKNDLNLSNTLLDEIIEDSVLKQWAATFQIIVTIDNIGVSRLHRILDDDISPIDSFRTLATGRRHETISDDELAKLLLKISSKENGQDVALDILNMRFHGENDSKIYSAALIDFGLFLLENHNFLTEFRKSELSNYNLSKVAEVCLLGEKAFSATKVLCQNLNEAFGHYTIYPTDYYDLLSVIAKKQSNVFLDAFVNKAIIDDYKRFGLFSNNFDNDRSPLDEIADTKIMSWCEVDPQSRYPAVSQVIMPFSEDNVSGELEWKPIVSLILNKAPSLERVLFALENAIHPSGWSGTLADVLQNRVHLLQGMLVHENAEVVAWATSAVSRLEQFIVSERERDYLLNSTKNESFE